MVRCRAGIKEYIVSCAAEEGNINIITSHVRFVHNYTRIELEEQLSVPSFTCYHQQVSKRQTRELSQHFYDHHHHSMGQSQGITIIIIPAIILLTKAEMVFIILQFCNSFAIYLCSICL